VLPFIAVPEKPCPQMERTFREVFSRTQCQYEYSMVLADSATLPLGEQDVRDKTIGGPPENETKGRVLTVGSRKRVV